MATPNTPATKKGGMVMKKPNRTRKSGARNFTISARGVHRGEPDISRLMKAALDHYRAKTTDENRPSTEDDGAPS